MNAFKTSVAEALIRGYVSLPLDLIKWWLRDRKLTEFEAFVLMISLVNFRNNEVSVPGGGKAICRRGESIRSIERWSNEFHWELDETRLFFEMLWEKGVLEPIERPISKNHIRIAEYERLTGKEGALASLRSGEKKFKEGARHAEVRAGAVGSERSLFDDFWELYHEITHTRPSERTRARMAWDRLTEDQQDRAIEGIEAYYAGLTLKKYCRKAATYLENQSFD
jgi:hypothetical protein